jgi:hypothetical protein
LNEAPGLLVVLNFQLLQLFVIITVPPAEPAPSPQPPLQPQLQPSAASKVGWKTVFATKLTGSKFISSFIPFTFLSFKVQPSLRDGSLLFEAILKEHRSTSCQQGTT